MPSLRLAWDEQSKRSYSARNGSIYDILNRLLAFAFVVIASCQVIAINPLQSHSVSRPCCSFLDSVASCSYWMIGTYALPVSSHLLACLRDQPLTAQLNAMPEA